MTVDENVDRMNALKKAKTYVKDDNHDEKSYLQGLFIKSLITKDNAMLKAISKDIKASQNIEVDGEGGFLVFDSVDRDIRSFNVEDHLFNTSQVVGLPENNTVIPTLRETQPNSSHSADNLSASIPTETLTFQDPTINVFNKSFHYVISNTFLQQKPQEIYKAFVERAKKDLKNFIHRNIFTEKIADCNPLYSYIPNNSTTPVVNFKSYNNTNASSITQRFLGDNLYGLMTNFDLDTDLAYVTHHTLESKLRSATQNIQGATAVAVGGALAFLSNQQDMLSSNGIKIYKNKFLRDLVYTGTTIDETMRVPDAISMGDDVATPIFLYNKTRVVFGMQPVRIGLSSLGETFNRNQTALRVVFRIGWTYMQSDDRLTGQTKSNIAVVTVNNA